MNFLVSLSRPWPDLSIPEDETNYLLMSTTMPTCLMPKGKTVFIRSVPNLKKQISRVRHTQTLEMRCFGQGTITMFRILLR
jgi:hypothetical protein